MHGNNFARLLEDSLVSVCKLNTSRCAGVKALKRKNAIWTRWQQFYGWMIVVWRKVNCCQ
jgi:hypothetical protein